MLKKEIYIHDTDCDMYRRLRKSSMLRMMQSAAVEHTESLGMGRAKTLDRGILWIVAGYHIKIDTLPCYDDTVTLRSWPGKRMHVLFPRFFTFSDSNEKLLISASSYWMLMDMNTRKYVSPESYGISIPEEPGGIDIPMPPAVRSPASDAEVPFKVPFSYIDLNGHMNNTRYLDVVDDLIPDFSGTMDKGSITVEFKNEIQINEEMHLVSEHTLNDAWIAGKMQQPIFKIHLHRE